MSPRISVFLPSHNKGGYAVEAVRSVLGQGFQDWELWLLENSTDDGRTRSILKKFVDLTDPRIIYTEIDLSEEIRQNYSPCAYINNRHYPKATGDIILYLSDDDLFVPELFQNVVNYFDANPEHNCVFFHLARTNAPKPGLGNLWEHIFSGILADGPLGPKQVDCVIDGGQVAYRKKVLDLLEQPYFYEGTVTQEACHADGLHLVKIAEAGGCFYPLPVKGVIHRHTPISTWSQME